MNSAGPGSETQAGIGEPVNLPGREVSCRAFPVLLEELRKKGHGPETWMAGVAYPLDHLLDEHERVDWSKSARRACRNAIRPFASTNVTTSP